MVFSLYIRSLLSERMGRPIRRPADCRLLADDIELKTGQHLGVNTVKRLFGMKADEREPRITTLDIVARYLGFSGWEALSALDTKSNSAFGTTEDGLPSSAIAGGATVTFTYLPDRYVTLRHESGDRFTVVESLNGKLRDGDEVAIGRFMKDYPLFLDNVRREGKNLGSLLLGKISGLTSIRILDGRPQPGDNAE